MSDFLSEFFVPIVAVLAVILFLGIIKGLYIIMNWFKGYAKKFYDKI